MSQKLASAAMPKKLLKRFILDHETIRNHKYLQIFGPLLNAPYLWHLSRRSVAGAFAVGLFITMLPIPFHMLLATGSAIFFRVNLPLSLALVWVNNPITMPPIFYFCYLLGAAILGRPVQLFNFSIPEDGFIIGLGGILAPFLLGCLICGSMLSITGYLGVHWLWRWHVSRRWKRRHVRRFTRN